MQPFGNAQANDKSKIISTVTRKANQQSRARPQHKRQLGFGCDGKLKMKNKSTISPLCLRLQKVS